MLTDRKLKRTKSGSRTPLPKAGSARLLSNNRCLTVYRNAASLAAMSKRDNSDALVPIGELIQAMSVAAPATQSVLDEHNVRAQILFREKLERAGISEQHPVARLVRPSVMQIESTTIDVDLWTTARRQRRVGVDLRIMGRTVTSFFESLHGSSTRQGTSISLTVENAVVHQKTQTKKEGENG